MPFTFSHPAIVLPLLNRRKQWFSASGLIIGSIIPDFESFIRVDEHKVYSHTWPGIFWFDLPLAILFAFIFHNVIRNPLIKNLPPLLNSKFYKYTLLNWNTFFTKKYIVVIYSALIGIFSHLLWDAFTHLNLADPNATDSQIYIGPVRLYILLQYSNSVIGLAIIAWYVFKKEMHDDGGIRTTGLKERSANFNQYWGIVALVATIVLILSVYTVPGPLNPILLIDIVISGTLIALIVTPFIQKGLAVMAGGK